MVRISDILKQRGPPPEPERQKKVEGTSPPEGASEKTEEKTSEGIQVTKAMAEDKGRAEKEMQVLKAMRQMQLDPEESKRIYNRASAFIKEVLSKAQLDAPIDLKEAHEIVKNIVDRIVLEDKELLLLITSSSEENYLYAHLVNAAILSVIVGLGLGYNKSKLNELGLGALLHDVGMAKVMDVANKPGVLDEEEYSKIKEHPKHGVDILSRVKDINQAIIYIVKQEHERYDGTGYPEGLEDDQINKYAQIVAVVDVFEALTHARPHRKAVESNEAIKELLTISSGGAFEALIIKTLINKVGLYPVGSWVELNTGEIAKVGSSNENSPLRPQVNIIFDADKEKLPQIKSIDLLRHTTIFIKRSLNPKDLNLKLE
jgi:HD-GYP domain-containing protein (c-di-GMP phosphodiesterase class II)